MSERAFSQNYGEARARFVDAALQIDAQLLSYPVKATNADDLTIDVAIIGSPTAPTLVTSSGVHGVEGFLGSAIQLTLLQRYRQSNAGADVRHVLIHAVNPFGFSRIRRCNEDNVDLNRNFVSNSTDFAGAPEDYDRLNHFLNPESPPSAQAAFYLKALALRCRYGHSRIKQAIARGQYNYPRGIFFGGRSTCRSTEILQTNCDAWIGESQNVVHLDWHSGLGRWGCCTLLLSAAVDSPWCTWTRQTFGNTPVESLHHSGGIAYAISGDLGTWMQRHFQPREYRFVGAEFGTYNSLRVLRALRAENQVHHYCNPDSPWYQSAKSEFLECFAPASKQWRRRVVDSGLQLIAQAEQALRQQR